MIAVEDRAQPRCTAGALFVDAEGAVFLVEPNERAEWAIPAGGVEHAETPRQACGRALQEKLGLDVVPGRLLVVDWAPRVREERVLFVFDGGELTDDQLDAIDMPFGVIDSWAFIDPDELFVMLEPRLTRRVTAALGARAAGTTWYLENGEPVGC
ncbi:MAG: NUDIX domain-containing protein [Pseudonocardia sp.]